MDNNLKIDKYSQKILDELLELNINKKDIDVEDRFKRNYFKSHEKINKYVQEEINSEYKREMKIILNNLKADDRETFFGFLILFLGFSSIALFRQDIELGIIGVFFGLLFAFGSYKVNKITKYNEKIDFISNNLLSFVKFPSTIQGRLNELEYYVEENIITNEIYLAIKNNWLNKLEELKEEEKRIDYYYKISIEEGERAKNIYDEKVRRINNEFIFFKIWRSPKIE